MGSWVQLLLTRAMGIEVTTWDAVDACDRLPAAASGILVCRKCVNTQDQAHRGI